MACARTSSSRRSGPDYLGRALHEARRWSPDGQLFINEFGLDYDLPDDQDRRRLLLKLLERLRKAGAPLDGLGVQAHLDLGKGPLAQAPSPPFSKRWPPWGWTSSSPNWT